MRDTLITLNRLKQEQIIADYAIGGAVAAFFYIEPSLTNDLDVFIMVGGGGDGLVLAPLYQRLRELGHGEFEHEEVVIGGWPVQFLPVSSALEREAFLRARDEIIEGVPVRVFSAEHLMAVCVATGRPKDKLRLSQFVADKAYDETVFIDIISRHVLLDKWRKIRALLDDE